MSLLVPFSLGEGNKEKTVQRGVLRNFLLAALQVRGPPRIVARL